MAKSEEAAVAAELEERMLSPWETMLQATGARLCYGEPVKDGDRTVIPVASVEAAGGGGWGKADSADDSGEPKDKGSGGGLGGWVSATPVGFIEIGPDGTRFRRIIDPVSLARGLAGAAAKGAVAWARERRRRR